MDMNASKSRTQLLLGAEAIQKLKNAAMAVLGLGGVGGSCAEALVRCGVGRLILVDHDMVQPSNLNRQVIAHAKRLEKFGA